jgi:hypothetical protein
MNIDMYLSQHILSLSCDNWVIIGLFNDVISTVL